MPAFAALDDEFVPGDASAPGLVGVRYEQRRPARFLRRDREGVGARQRAVLSQWQGGARGFDCGGRAVIGGVLDHAGGGNAVIVRGGIGCDRRAEFGPQRLARHQRSDHVVETEEERLAQRKARRHVHTVDRKQVGELQFVGVFGGELVEAAGISFEQGACVGGKGGIAPLRSAARVEEVIDVIDLRALFPGDGAIASAAHRDHVLKREKIVLRVGDGDAIGDVRIGLAIDVRNAEFVAHDLCAVDPAGRRAILVLRCEERLPRRQGHEPREQHDQQGTAQTRQPFSHVKSLLCPA